MPAGFPCRACRTSRRGNRLGAATSATGMRSTVRHATRHVECHLLGHRVHDLCHRCFRCPARNQCQHTAARHMRREGRQHNRARGPRCRERSARTGGRAPSHWRHDWTAVPGPAIHPPDSVQARHREGGSTLLRDDHGRAGRDAEVGEFRVVDEGELRLALTERGRGGRLRQAMVRAYSCAGGARDSRTGCPPRTLPRVSSRVA